MARSAIPNVAHRLKGLPFEELDSVARTLEDLQAHPGWSVVQQIIDGEIADVDGKLDRGDVPLDQASYALLHGKRGALLFPRDAVATVLDKHRERKAEIERTPEASRNGR